MYHCLTCWFPQLYCKQCPTDSSQCCFNLFTPVFFQIRAHDSLLEETNSKSASVAWNCRASPHKRQAAGKQQSWSEKLKVLLIYWLANERSHLILTTGQSQLISASLKIFCACFALGMVARSHWQSVHCTFFFLCFGLRHKEWLGRAWWIQVSSRIFGVQISRWVLSFRCLKYWFWSLENLWGFVLQSCFCDCSSINLKFSIGVFCVIRILDKHH